MELLFARCVGNDSVGCEAAMTRARVLIATDQTDNKETDTIHLERPGAIPIHSNLQTEPTALLTAGPWHWSVAGALLFWFCVFSNWFRSLHTIVMEMVKLYFGLVIAEWLESNFVACIRCWHTTHLHTHWRHKRTRRIKTLMKTVYHQGTEYASRNILDSELAAVDRVGLSYNSTSMQHEQVCRV